MTVAALAGLGSGALHAVSGPDHLLSLAPLSLRIGRRAWRVGLLWGVGHALGTLLCAAAVMGAASALDLDMLQTWGERLAGATLLVTGVVGLRRWVTHRMPGKALATPRKNAASAWSLLTLGFIHGLTGAAAVLLLLLPVAMATSRAWQALYLGGFILGSTLAMAALTAALSAGSSAMPRPEVLLRHVPAVASFGSVVLGSWWMLA